MHIVSTDGSCLKNPGGAIGWAWVDQNGRRFDSGGAASGTNQIAELTAILQAIRAYPDDEPLLIESDSQYAIRCSSEWLPGWKRKGWRTASNKEISNLELIQAIDAALTERAGPVRFHWVRGHVGNVFNERADTLANTAARDWAAGRGVSGRLFAESDYDAPVKSSGQKAVAGGTGADRTNAAGEGQTLATTESQPLPKRTAKRTSNPTAPTARVAQTRVAQKKTPEYELVALF